MRFGGLSFFVAAMAGCGGGGGGSSNSSTPLSTEPVFTNVSGVAAAGAPIIGLVWLKDSNGTQIGPKIIGTDRRFIFDIKGLKAPFYLCVDGTVGPTNYTSPTPLPIISCI